MMLGPFLFGAPLALIGLIALPVIWYILRATPPAPKEADLPSLRLLDDYTAQEEEPARTPWWILLLRLVAAAAAIIGLSQPVYAPGASPASESSGPVLVVLDNGWTSAARWSEMRTVAASALDGEARNTPAHLLLTAPRTLNVDPAERLSKTELPQRVNSLDPVSWDVDRANALERLDASGLQPGRIFWITDGLTPDTAIPFARDLAARAPLSIYAAPPRGPVAITGLSSDAEGASVELTRAALASDATYFVSALTLDGAAIGTAQAAFTEGNATALAGFDIPAAALARVARFQITGADGAGAVWLWDSSARSRRVGLVSGDATAQPLLSDMHYVRKALEPFASITEGDIVDLIAANPDAIIMTDIGRLSPDVEADVAAWVEKGGALIRFAGPRMAAQSDSLVPTPLRRSSRAIGGALTWEEPQSIGSFPDGSPFAGLSAPEDLKIRQQVLARPDPELANRTWARLTDGSPLVTAAPRGQGMLVLFHVTAGPDWSDVSYSGLFVEMLRRAIAAGRGEAVADAEGTYSPDIVLNGYGRLVSPDSSATPVAAADFADITPSEANPPGLYRGPAGTRAINAGDGATIRLMTDWPASARLLGDAEARSLRLGGPLLGLAGLLLAIDLIVALAIAGRLPLPGRASQAVIGVLALASLGVIAAPSADAQQPYRPSPYGYGISPGYGADINVKGEIDKATEAALDMRLAYIPTGDASVDRATLAGLRGLSLMLYRRTSVEPAEPHEVNPETDALDVYPVIFIGLSDAAAPLSADAVRRLNDYLRNGGALFIDTRRGGDAASTNNFADLERVLSGLDTPPLEPVPTDHVLTRSFYLLDGFPGRYENRRLWIESSGIGEKTERRGDGVSRLIIGDADYLAAWAVDERGRPIYSVDGGDEQREMARRFGINLIMYVLTGNYKEDQVHIPALLERLGQGDEGEDDFNIDDIPRIQDGGPQ
ncbi:DUF4159 domain-containing protein [Henriciella pelagia]|jgi:hypothetical protein|uniref:RNA-binding protein n=2 Tax=Henriciella pelagia TaxID=1977912 RepID=A0ABQ1JCT6_9PROT|nr:DUF4159 domain-containing protein [Henriciella pelagia]GGB65667.1 RNA-binding protein [Henriciella pelagia]